MTRFALTVTILSCVLTAIALTADGQENSSAKAAAVKAAPIYAKILWPVDPDAPVIEKDRPVIESWIAKSIEKRHQANFRAVTGWVPLVDEPLEATELWDGTLDGKYPACGVYADITERKEGWIKITFRGWGPGGQEANLTMKEEPGSRDVVPVTEAELKHGVPRVAIFIGLQIK